jgi:hypothetical protein
MTLINVKKQPLLITWQLFQNWDSKIEIQDGGLLQINRNTLINNKPYEDKREKVNGVDVEEKPPSS